MDIIPPLTIKAVLVKLKTNLSIIINRLKLLERKKTEMGIKARKEISGYIKEKKYEKARIKVEHIIREDYLVEAYEMLELFCDLVLARFGLLEYQKDIDPGLEEALASIVWSVPRMKADLHELQIIEDMLARKYSKDYVVQCHQNINDKVNKDLIHRVTAYVPSKKLVEMYLLEIAKNFKLEYHMDLPPDDYGGPSETDYVPSVLKIDSKKQNQVIVNGIQQGEAINCATDNDESVKRVAKSPSQTHTNTINTDQITNQKPPNSDENDLESRFNKLKFG